MCKARTPDDAEVVDVVSILSASPRPISKRALTVDLGKIKCIQLNPTQRSHPCSIYGVLTPQPN